MALRRRLEDYTRSLKKSLDQGDPLDSQFFHGFDQAIHNVVRVLDNILEETESNTAEKWARDRAEAIRGALGKTAYADQDAWDRGYDAAWRGYLMDLEEFLKMLEEENSLRESTLALERFIRDEESAAPRPEDVPVGEPWQVEVYGKAAIGYRNDPEARLCWAALCRDDAGNHWASDSDVSLIARLVSETAEQDKFLEMRKGEEQ